MSILTSKNKAMMHRRDILRSSLVAASTFTIPRTIRGYSLDASLHEKSKKDVDHAVLADRYRDVALNIAAQLGVDYTDVRLSYRRKIDVNLLRGFHCEERLCASVRTLVNGYWGFCCTPIWSENTIRLAVELAYNQAKGNSQGPSREINLAAYTAQGESGEWITPITIDPFSRNPYEFMDYLWGLFEFIQSFPKQTAYYRLNMVFDVENIWFGATNNARQYQRLYRTSGDAGFQLMYGSGPRFDVETLPLSGVGYELFTGQDLYSQLREGFDEAMELSKLPGEPLDVGRYTIVLPGSGVAALLGTSLGGGIELDRIVGVEANAGGTSYIQDPAEELGQFKFGNRSLQVDFDRDDPGAAGTRRWDDEGTACVKGSLVEDGIIKRAFADKEMSIYVSSPDQIAGGNSITGDPTIAPAVRPANMVMGAALSGATSVREMIKDVKEGFYFRKSSPGLDFQMTTGMLSGEVYQIRNGRLVNRVSTQAGCWFKSTELWNNIERIGGPSSQQRIGIAMQKGQPPSSSTSSVTAPAVQFADATLIDSSRK